MDNLYSYRVTVNPENTSCAWTGYVHAESIQEAKRMGVEIAENMGGDWLDVTSVELSKLDEFRY